jgi:NADH-quinone oxidoreductase subunit E
VDIATLDKLCDKYTDERGAIVELLQTIQSEEHYLPREALERVSGNLDIPLSQLYGLATFYRAFSLKPVGKHQVLCCTGTACHVRGSKRVVDHFRRVLGLEIGDTTQDGLFSLHTVNCLGACAVAPVAVIDGVCHGEMTAANVEKLVRKLRGKSGE